MWVKRFLSMDHITQCYSTQFSIPQPCPNIFHFSRTVFHTDCHSPEATADYSTLLCILPEKPSVRSLPLLHIHNALHLWGWVEGGYSGDAAQFLPDTLSESCSVIAANLRSTHPCRRVSRPQHVQYMYVLFHDVPFMEHTPLSPIPITLLGPLSAIVCVAGPDPQDAPSSSLLCHCHLSAAQSQGLHTPGTCTLQSENIMRHINKCTHKSIQYKCAEIERKHT